MNDGQTISPGWSRKNRVCELGIGCHNVAGAEQVHQPMQTIREGGA